MNSRLKIALANRKTANDVVESVLHEDFPKGTPVTWQHNTFWQRGRVERHGYGDVIFVINNRSGKTLRLRADAICRR